MDYETERRQCVIIGGGIAGLAAAAELESAGLDFILLEADDRLGGRIHTHEESRGQVGVRPLELGAQWLHGTIGNSLFDFCVEEGFFDSAEGMTNLTAALTRSSFADFKARRPDGTEVDIRHFLHLFDAWSEAIIEAEDLGSERVAQDAAASIARNSSTPAASQHTLEAENPVNDGSMLHQRVGEFLRKRMREHLQNEGHASAILGDAALGAEIDAGILGYLERLQCSIDGCNDLQDASLAGYGAYEELSGGNVRVPGGFSSVIEALASKVCSDRIRLKSPVSAINWEEGKTENAVSPTLYPCTVEYRTESTDSHGGIESRSRSIECQYVVVTLGLGVLKDEAAVRFSPPLPSAKLSAIRRLGFGTVDKFFVRCTRKSGVADMERADTCAGNDKAARVGPDASMNVAITRPASAKTREVEDSQSKGWIDDIFSFASEGQHVYFWLTGNSAKVAERASAVEVQEGMLSLLKNITRDCSWRAEDGSHCHGDVDRNLGEGTPFVRTARQNYPPIAVGLAEEGKFSGGCGCETYEQGTLSLIRSTWNSNPLFRGSYSYIAAGSSADDIDELARPLAYPDSLDRSSVELEGEQGQDNKRPRLFFAGEATHRSHFSTAHGGFESGKRAAREVLSWVPRE